MKNLKIKPHERKLNRALALASLGLLLLAGCVSPHGNLVLDPVGPPPGPSEGGADGSLVVYSLYTPNDTLYNPNPRVTCTDYKIFSKDGSLLQKVHNDTGSIVGGPASVDLPAGYYQIEAQANGGYGYVKVPVVIKGKQVTVVHLDGGGSWPNRDVMIQAGAVRLPDGRIVGWRASP